MRGRLFLPVLFLCFVGVLSACARLSPTAEATAQPAFTAVTQPPPAASRTIRVAINAEAPPFAYLDPQTQ